MDPLPAIGGLTLSGLLLYIAKLLWAEHVKDDARIEKQLDESLASGHVMVNAMADLAEAWNARNRADEVKEKRTQKIASGKAGRSGTP